MPHTSYGEFFRRVLPASGSGSGSTATVPDTRTDRMSTTGWRRIGLANGTRPIPGLGALPQAIQEAVENSDLGTTAQAIQTSQFGHCRLYIHGIYAGAAFDGGLNGKTGEWYFTSLVTDGNEVVGVGSKDMGDENGRWVKVVAGSFLDTGDRLIWPKTSNYNEAKDLGVPNGNITVALNVMEDDDGELAKSILNKVGKISRAWLDQQFPGNEAAEVTHDQLLSLAQDALDIYAADDRPLSEQIGLDQSTNYRIGQFIKMTGQQGSFAILGVQPKGTANTTVYQIENHELPPGISERRISLTTDADTPKLVALFVRPPVYIPGFPGIRVEVLNPLHEGRSFKVIGRPGVFHTMVRGGADDVSVKVTAPVGAVLRMMVTAVGKEGAAPYSD